MPKYDDYPISVGLQLATVNGQRFSNAIVVGLDTDERALVLTDFGNVMIMSYDKIRRNWSPSQNYLEYIKYGGAHETVQQRIEMQINLLEVARKALHEHNKS